MTYSTKYHNRECALVPDDEPYWQTSNVPPNIKFETFQSKHSMLFSVHPNQDSKDVSLSLMGIYELNMMPCLAFLLSQRGPWIHVCFNKIHSWVFASPAARTMPWLVNWGRVVNLENSLLILLSWKLRLTSNLMLFCRVLLSWHVSQDHEEHMAC